MHSYKINDNAFRELLNLNSKSHLEPNVMLKVQLESDECGSIAFTSSGSVLALVLFGIASVRIDTSLVSLTRLPKRAAMTVQASYLTGSNRFQT